jgi:hypothetical protein
MKWHTVAERELRKKRGVALKFSGEEIYCTEDQAIANFRTYNYRRCARCV